MDKFLNVVRREAQRIDGQVAKTVAGIVTSYDPVHYAAKVLLQPGNKIETGFLPIASPWVGPNFGFYAAPTPGDLVDVHFLEGDKLSPYIEQRFFTTSAPPLPVPSGECWIVHKSGSFLKFPNDTTIEIKGIGNNNVTTPTLNLTGNLVVTGTIQATGDIIDNYLSGGYTMASFRSTYDAHLHSGVQGGSGNTGTTTIPL